MGRHRIHVRTFEHGFAGGPRWSDPYYCEWGVVVGDRVRRLRKERGLNLAQFALLVERPHGGHYSAGYFSRLERGWASAPLYVYLAVADALDVRPGRLLGLDEAQKDVTDAEMTLIRFLQEVGLAPHQALACLAGSAAAGAVAGEGSA